MRMSRRLAIYGAERRYRNVAVEITSDNIATSESLCCPGDSPGAPAGDFCVYAGGAYSTGTTRYNTGEAISIDYSLTLSKIATSNAVGYGTSAGSIKDKAFFAGGEQFMYGIRNTACTYDANLTMTTLQNLSAARCGLACASNESYLIYGGGESNKISGTIYYDNTDAYDYAGTRVSPSVPSGMLYRYSGTGTRSRAIFANYEKLVSYDKSLTFTSGTIPSPVREQASFRNSRYGMFVDRDGAKVIAYNDSLVATTISIPTITTARCGCWQEIKGIGVMIASAYVNSTVGFNNYILTVDESLTLTQTFINSFNGSNNLVPIKKDKLFSSGATAGTNRTPRLTLYATVLKLS